MGQSSSSSSLTEELQNRPISFPASIPNEDEFEMNIPVLRRERVVDIREEGLSNDESQSDCRTNEVGDERVVSHESEIRDHTLDGMVGISECDTQVESTNELDMFPNLDVSIVREGPSEVELQNHWDLFFTEDEASIDVEYFANKERPIERNVNNKEDSISTEDEFGAPQFDFDDSIVSWLDFSDTDEQEEENTTKTNKPIKSDVIRVVDVPIEKESASSPALQPDKTRVIRWNCKLTSTRKAALSTKDDDFASFDFDKPYEFIQQEAADAKKCQNIRDSLSADSGSKIEKLDVDDSLTNWLISWKDFSYSDEKERTAEQPTIDSNQPADDSGMVVVVSTENTEALQPTSRDDKVKTKTKSNFNRFLNQIFRGNYGASDKSAEELEQEQPLSIDNGMQVIDMQVNEKPIELTIEKDCSSTKEKSIVLNEKSNKENQTDNVSADCDSQMQLFYVEDPIINWLIDRQHIANLDEEEEETIKDRIQSATDPSAKSGDKIKTKTKSKLNRFLNQIFRRNDDTKGKSEEESDKDPLSTDRGMEELPNEADSSKETIENEEKEDKQNDEDDSIINAWLTSWSDFSYSNETTEQIQSRNSDSPKFVSHQPKTEDFKENGGDKIKSKSTNSLNWFLEQIFRRNDDTLGEPEAKNPNEEEPLSSDNGKQSDEHTNEIESLLTKNGSIVHESKSEEESETTKPTNKPAVAPHVLSVPTENTHKTPEYQPETSHPTTKCYKENFNLVKSKEKINLNWFLDQIFRRTDREIKEIGKLSAASNSPKELCLQEHHNDSTTNQFILSTSTSEADLNTTFDLTLADDYFLNERDGELLRHKLRLVIDDPKINQYSFLRRKVIQILDEFKFGNPRNPVSVSSIDLPRSFQSILQKPTIVCQLELLRMLDEFKRSNNQLQLHLTTVEQNSNNTIFVTINPNNLQQTDKKCIVEANKNCVVSSYAVIERRFECVLHQPTIVCMINAEQASSEKILNLNTSQMCLSECIIYPTYQTENSKTRDVSKTKDDSKTSDNSQTNNNNDMYMSKNQQHNNSADQKPFSLKYQIHSKIQESPSNQYTSETELQTEEPENSDTTYNKYSRQISTLRVFGKAVKNTFSRLVRTEEQLKNTQCSSLNTYEGTSKQQQQQQQHPIVEHLYENNNISLVATKNEIGDVKENISVNSFETCNDALSTRNHAIVGNSVENQITDHEVNNIPDIVGLNDILNKEDTNFSKQNIDESNMTVNRCDSIENNTSIEQESEIINVSAALIETNSLLATRNHDVSEMALTDVTKDSTIIQMTENNNVNIDSTEIIANENLGAYREMQETNADDLIIENNNNSDECKALIADMPKIVQNTRTNISAELHETDSVLKAINSVKNEDITSLASIAESEMRKTTPNIPIMSVDSESSTKIELSTNITTKNHHESIDTIDSDVKNTFTIAIENTSILLPQSNETDQVNDTSLLSQEIFVDHNSSISSFGNFPDSTLKIMQTNISNNTQKHSDMSSVTSIVHDSPPINNKSSNTVVDTECNPKSGVTDSINTVDYSKNDRESTKNNESRQTPIKHTKTDNIDADYKRMFDDLVRNWQPKDKNKAHKHSSITTTTATTNNVNNVQKSNYLESKTANSSAISNKTDDNISSDRIEKEQIVVPIFKEMENAQKTLPKEQQTHQPMVATKTNSNVTIFTQTQSDQKLTTSTSKTIVARPNSKEMSTTVQNIPSKEQRTLQSIVAIKSNLNVTKTTQKQTLTSTILAETYSKTMSTVQNIPSKEQKTRQSIVASKTNINVTKITEKQTDHKHIRTSKAIVSEPNPKVMSTVQNLPTKDQDTHQPIVVANTNSNVTQTAKKQTDQKVTVTSKTLVAVPNIKVMSTVQNMSQKQQTITAQTIVAPKTELKQLPNSHKPPQPVASTQVLPIQKPTKEMPTIQSIVPGPAKQTPSIVVTSNAKSQMMPTIPNIPQKPPNQQIVSHPTRPSVQTSTVKNSLNPVQSAKITKIGQNHTLPKQSMSITNNSLKPNVPSNPNITHSVNMTNAQPKTSIQPKMSTTKTQQFQTTKQAASSNNYPQSVLSNNKSIRNTKNVPPTIKQSNQQPNKCLKPIVASTTIGNNISPATITKKNVQQKCVSKNPTTSFKVVASASKPNTNFKSNSNSNKLIQQTIVAPVAEKKHKSLAVKSQNKTQSLAGRFWCTQCNCDHYANPNSFLNLKTNRKKHQC